MNRGRRCYPIRPQSFRLLYSRVKFDLQGCPKLVQLLPVSKHRSRLLPFRRFWCNCSKTMPPMRPSHSYIDNFSFDCESALLGPGTVPSATRCTYNAGACATRLVDNISRMDSRRRREFHASFL
ncbi:hypothetical protein M758_UG160200 [Ceratodon purpureus]|nr:hypothetical protein M758_UG160200 [Ceratodon purpureus]